jgi:hypothetical protein
VSPAWFRPLRVLMVTRRHGADVALGNALAVILPPRPPTPPPAPGSGCWPLEVRGLGRGAGRIDQHGLPGTGSPDVLPTRQLPVVTRLGSGRRSGRRSGAGRHNPGDGVAGLLGGRRHASRRHGQKRRPDTWAPAHPGTSVRTMRWMASYTSPVFGVSVLTRCTSACSRRCMTAVTQRRPGVDAQLDAAHRSRVPVPARGRRAVRPRSTALARTYGDEAEGLPPVQLTARAASTGASRGGPGHPDAPVAWAYPASREHPSVLRSSAQDAQLDRR